MPIWIALFVGLAEPSAIVLPPEQERQHVENGPLNDAEIQRIEQILPGMTAACVAKIRAGGMKAMPSRSEDRFQMTPSRRWTGLWRNDFEGSQFCEAPATRCEFADSEKRSIPTVWLNFAGRLPEKFKTEQGALYAVEFVGRRTVAPGMYGHMGIFDGEIVVDQMISMKEIQPTKQEDAEN